MSKQQDPHDEAGRSTPTNDVVFDADARSDFPFMIACIGVSPAATTTLSAFFGALSPRSKVAWVVVLHEDRSDGDRSDAAIDDATLVDRLSNLSSVPVSLLADDTPVEPDRVYLTPRSSSIELHAKRFRVRPQGKGVAFDDFLRSLAAAQADRCAAVVLAGPGTRGAAGAQIIKAAGGICIAQSPDSAELPGMPTTLVRAGYADEVLAPEAIPPLLARYALRMAQTDDSIDDKRAPGEGHAPLTEILALLRARTGHYFAGYRHSTLMRRIQRRMGLAGASDVNAYADLLRARPTEAEALANDLMINVSGFFRDPEAWEALRVRTIRPLVEQYSPGDPIRAWVAGCASGEEAFTLAIVITEEAERAGKRVDAKIFATDTADGSLQRARAGLYPVGIESDLSTDRLTRFFRPAEAGFQVRDDVRSMVVFAPHDLLRDPPFSRLDLCTCRNVLIYLEPPIQRQVLEMMHFALRPNGTLMLGGAEGVGSRGDLFAPVDRRSRIFRRADAARAAVERTPVATMPVLGRRASASSLPTGPRGVPTTFALQAALLDAAVPPTVVIDAEDRAVYFHGDTNPFLAHPAGEPTSDLFELLRPQIRAAARTALRQARRENGEVRVLDGPMVSDGGRVMMTVSPLAPSTSAARGNAHYRVTFEIAPIGASAASSDEAQGKVVSLHPPILIAEQADLEEELRIIRRELQSTLDAYESNNEELRAAHEEVTAINEELQSANEELEAGREELHSLNEALQAANGLLQEKIDELQRNNDDLANLLASTDVAVLFLDTSCRVRRFTPTINDLVELIPDDVGRPITDLVAKFSGPDIADDAKLVVASLQPADAEVQALSGRTYLRRTLPYRTVDNRIDGVVVTFVDITARKRAERSAVSTRSRMQAVIDHLPTGVVLVDAPSGRLALVNRRAASLLGHPYPLPARDADWTTTLAAFHAFRPDGHPLAPADFPLARTLADGKPVMDEEVAYLRADGTRGSMLVSTAPVSDAEGRMVASVATLLDISELKRAEATLRESEERFRLLVESAPDYAIIMIDPHGRIASWNAGAERLTGWSDTEAIGQDVAILFTPEDRAAGAPARELATARIAGRALDERWHVRRDGSRFFASGTMTVARAGEASGAAFVKVMRDVTERRRSEERLRDALQTAQALRASAESANSAKDDFIATVSHELRTPLNTIKLWSNLLATGRLPEKDAADGIRMIDRAAQAQQQLIEDLLDVSRMTSGKLRLSLRRTPVIEAIRSAIDAVRPTAEGRGLRLEAELSPAVGVVLADADRIQQVVWNLLSNAVKFTNAGGYVRVRVSRSGDNVEIRVSDSGVGISPAFLPHVFDRFRQAQAASTRTHRGLGLGLAITRQLVELHGGEIRATSDGEGKGATFTVRMPLPAQSAPSPSDERPDRGRAAADLAGVSILLVEDDDASADATRRLLESSGARVRVAISAPEARAAIACEAPDLVLSDIGLPGESGLALLRGLREAERANGGTRVPAVALSAFAREEDRRQAMEAGFDAHLPKPVEPARLMDLLERLGRKSH